MITHLVKLISTNSQSIADHSRKTRSTTSGSSTLSTFAIRRIVECLKNQRCRDSTRKMYHRVRKLFGKFYSRLDVKPPTWEERITLFAGFLIENKLKSTTVKTYLSALRSVLAEDGHKLNEDLFLMNSLTHACILKNDQLTIRFTIYKELLHIIINEARTWFSLINQPYLQILVPALLMTGYYGLLRAGELTYSPHSILAKNVHIGTNKNKIMLMLRSSKTHSECDEPQVIKINSKPLTVERHTISAKFKQQHHYSLCPFRTLANYLSVRPPAQTENEQFFVYSDNSSIKPEQLRSQLRIILEWLNMNPRTV